MSVEATAWAWRQSLEEASARSRQTDKLVLLALANYADEHGQCWPSQQRIAAMIGCSTDSVQRSIARLCAIGVISKRSRGKQGGGRTSDLFVLQMSTKEQSDAPLNRKMRLNVKPQDAVIKNRTAVRYEASVEQAYKKNPLTPKPPASRPWGGVQASDLVKGVLLRGNPEAAAELHERAPLAGWVVEKAKGLGAPADTWAREVAAPHVKHPTALFRKLAEKWLGEQLPGLRPELAKAALSGSRSDYAAVLNLMTMRQAARA